MEDVDAAHMLFVARFIDPLVAPAHHTTMPKARNIFNLDVGLGRFAEEVMQKLGDGFFACVYGAIGGGMAVFKETIVAQKLYHAWHIMAVKGFVERQDNPNRGFYA